MKQYTKNVYAINPEDRVNIGRTFGRIPLWRLIIGIPLIYIPALTSVPFMIIGVWIVRMHLTFIGARNLKRYRDFIPKRKSYRYTYKKQLTIVGAWYTGWARTRVFWFYNCGIYCPLSIGLMEYYAYLTKVVENWWCPFYHDRKSDYAGASLDASFWHASPRDVKNLHPDDLNCPIYTDEKDKKK